MIYFLKRSDGLVKIGTTKQFNVRVKQLEKKYGKLTFVAWQPGDEDYEAKLHNRFTVERVTGEWFEFSPRIQKYIDDNCALSTPPLRPKSNEMPVSRMWQIIQEQKLYIDSQSKRLELVEKVAVDSIEIARKFYSKINEQEQRIRDLEKLNAELTEMLSAQSPMLKSA